MDLDIDVQRLKLLKANHLSQRYALEDAIIKELPQTIASLEQRIEGNTADMNRLKENTHPIVVASSASLASPQEGKLAHSAASPLPIKSDDFAGIPGGFSPMEVEGTVYTEKKQRAALSSLPAKL